MSVIAVLSVGPVVQTLMFASGWPVVSVTVPVIVPPAAKCASIPVMVAPSAALTAVAWSLEVASL